APVKTKPPPVESCWGVPSWRAEVGPSVRKSKASALKESTVVARGSRRGSRESRVRRPDSIAMGIAVSEVSSDFLDLCVVALTRAVVLDILEASPLRFDGGIISPPAVVVARQASQRGQNEESSPRDTPTSVPSLHAVMQQLDETCMSLTHGFDIEESFSISHLSEIESACDSPGAGSALSPGSDGPPCEVEELEPLACWKTECSLVMEDSLLVRQPSEESGSANLTAILPEARAFLAEPALSTLERENQMGESTSQQSATEGASIRGTSVMSGCCAVDVPGRSGGVSNTAPSVEISHIGGTSTSSGMTAEGLSALDAVLGDATSGISGSSGGLADESMGPLSVLARTGLLDPGGMATDELARDEVPTLGTAEGETVARDKATGNSRRSSSLRGKGPLRSVGRGKIRERGTSREAGKYSASKRSSVLSGSYKARHRGIRPSAKSVRGWSLELARSGSEPTDSGKEAYGFLASEVSPAGLQSQVAEEVSDRPRSGDTVHVSAGQGAAEVGEHGDSSTGVPETHLVNIDPSQSAVEEGHKSEKDTCGSEVELSLSPSPRSRHTSRPGLSESVEDIILEHCSGVIEHAETAAVNETAGVDELRCRGHDSESVSVMSSCSSARAPREAVLPWLLSRQDCDDAAPEQSRVSVIGSGLNDGSDRALWDDSSNSSAGGTTAQCDCHEDEKERTTDLPTHTVRKISKGGRPTGDGPPPVSSRKGPFFRGSLRRASSDTSFEKPPGALIGGRASSSATHASPPSTGRARGNRLWSRRGRVSEAILRSLSGSRPSIAEVQRCNEDSTPPQAGPSNVTVEHEPELPDRYCITRPLGSPASAPTEILSPLSASGGREALGRLCERSVLKASVVHDDPFQSLAAHGRAHPSDSDGSETGSVESTRAIMGGSRSSKFAVLSVEEEDAGSPGTPLEALPRRRRREGSVRKSRVGREHPDSADNEASAGLVTSARSAEFYDAPTVKSPDDKGSEETPLTPNSVWNMGSSSRGGDSPRQSEVVDIEEAEVASPVPVTTATRDEQSPTSSPELCGDRNEKVSPSASVEMVCGMDVEEPAGVDFHRAVAVDSRQVEVLGPLPLHEPSPSSLGNPRRCVLEDSRFSRRLKMSSHRFRKKKTRGFSAGPEEDSLSGRVGPAVFASQDGNEVSAYPEPDGAESFGDLEKRVVLLPEPTGIGGPASTCLSTVESTPLVRSPAVVSSRYSRVEESITIYSSLTAIPGRREGSLLRKGLARPAPNLSLSILQGRRQRLVSFVPVPVPMDWVCSRFTFRGHPFHV
ncbi:hypothetical protein FOZ63_027474, partial [Perkinsus olseni]